MIAVEHRSTPSGTTYDYAEIEVWVGRGSFVVSASRYADGERQLALTLRGPRGGYLNAVVLEAGQAEVLQKVLRRGAPATLCARWGYFVMEPIVAAGSVWDGLCSVGYESSRGNVMWHLVSAACRNDLAAAVRFVTEEAWGA